MRIRPARQTDFDAVRRVAERSWEAAYANILGDETIERTVADWYSDEALAEALDTPGTAFLVAVDEPAGGDSADGDVMGFCHGVVQGDEGDVLRMYVDPDHWGEGIGTRLHERLRDDLLDFNMKRMRAIVLAENDLGNQFYRGLGFEETGSGEVDLNGETYRETVYTLELSSEMEAGRSTSGAGV